MAKGSIFCGPMFWSENKTAEPHSLYSIGTFRPRFVAFFVVLEVRDNTDKPVRIDEQRAFMWLSNDGNWPTRFGDTFQNKKYGCLYGPWSVLRVKRPSQCTSMAKRLSVVFWKMKLYPPISEIRSGQELRPFVAFGRFVGPCCGLMTNPVHI